MIALWLTDFFRSSTYRGSGFPPRLLVVGISDGGIIRLVFPVADGLVDIQDIEFIQDRPVQLKNIFAGDAIRFQQRINQFNGFCMPHDFIMVFDGLALDGKPFCQYEAGFPMCQAVAF